MHDFDWDTASPRERDAAIAQHIMGWEVVTEDDEQPDAVPYLVSPTGWGIYYPSVAAKFPDVYPCHDLPPFSTDAAADYLVLERVRTEKWIDEREDVFNRFWTHLAEILRSRDPYYRGTVNQRELYYMLEYRPGDFSHAAWLALRETAATTQETTHER